MAKSFHGGIKIRKKIFSFSPHEGDVSVKNGCTCVYKIPHDGVVCVSEGDDISAGSVLVRSEEFVPTLSGVSGKVTSIVNNEIRVTADAEQRKIPAFHPLSGTLSQIPPEEICMRLCDCAVSSKYTPNGIFSVCNEARALSGTSRIRLIVDCSSPTEVSSINRYLIKNYPQEISGGIRVLMRACMASEAILVCDDSSMSTIRTLESISDGKYVKLLIAQAKYPMQNEKLIFYLASGRERSDKKKAIDYGVVLSDCEASLNAYRATVLGEMTVSKFVSVRRCDDVECISVPLGLPIGNLSYEGNDCDFVLKGEFASSTIPREEMCKHYADSSSEVLIFGKGKKAFPASPCIGCGRCEEACPMYLPVSRIVLPSPKEARKNYEKYSFSVCIDCGCCSAVCPCRLEIRDYIKGGAQENEQ